MKRSILLVGVLLAAGCKSEEKTATPPAAPVSVSDASTAAMAAADAAQGAAAAGDPSFPLGAGETLRPGDKATNTVVWTVADGTVITLGIVATGKDDGGREKGVLREVHDGKGTDLESYTIDPAAEHWAELKVLSPRRALFRYGEKGERRVRRGVVLVWNEKDKRVDVAKRWSGTTADADPEWFATGEYKPAPEAIDLCMKVVARMVQCARDPKFRDGLFHVDAAARADAEKKFDTQVAQWRKPAAAKEQCQKWSTDEYADTHFSDVDHLKQMADDTKKMDCQLFGHEIDDEGGLPRLAGSVAPPSPRP